jgi:GT2 family glycosyltransferase
MDVTGISVVIPNYNGEQLLRENLPSVIAALDSWGAPSELIVVDDASTDGSCRLLRESFPEVVLLVNSENSGFSRTCNAGMAAVRHPVVFCVNTDVEVERDLVAPIIQHFADDSVFSVTPNILVERDGLNQGIVRGLYGKGFLKGSIASFTERGGVRENLYSVGACVAYDTAKLKALGGYCEIYTPYLFEDVDLSYRAWKRGWRSIYEHGATVHHYSSATISREKKRIKRTIYFRNRFLFHWINLSDPSFIARNLAYTLLRLSVSFLWGDLAYYAAFAKALQRSGEVRKLRAALAGHRTLTDREILHRTARSRHGFNSVRECLHPQLQPASVYRPGARFNPFPEFYGFRAAGCR